MGNGGLAKITLTRSCTDIRMTMELTTPRTFAIRLENCRAIALNDASSFHPAPSIQEARIRESKLGVILGVSLNLSQV